MTQPAKLPTGLYRCPGCGLEAQLHPPSCDRLTCGKCGRPLERLGDLLPRKKRSFDRWRGVWR